MKQYDPNILRDRLLMTIGENGISMAELSRAIGVGYTTVTHWVYRGNAPSAWNLLQICDYLHVSPWWLMGWDEEQ